MASANYSTSTYAASATGAQAPIQIDWRDSIPSTIAYQVVYNAGASGSGSIQYTLDNAADPNVTPVWTTLGSAIAATGYGVIGFPVQFVRLNIGSLSGGTLTFNVLQGSVLGDGTSGAAGGGATGNVNITGPVGQKASAASIPVVLASDQSAVPVAPTGYTYTNISTDTTTQVKTGTGVLHAVVVNTAGTGASSITISDSTSAGTPLVAIINGLATGYYVFDAAVTAGIRVTTTGTVAPNITVMYR